VKTDTGLFQLTTTGSGIFVYSYGYVYAESYYYSAGISLSASEDSIVASNLTGSGSNCTNDSILFEATAGSGTPLSYSWYFGDGDSSSLDSPIHQYSNPGSYQVSVIINYSCISDTIIDSIHMLSCGITALSDTTICLGNTVELSVSGSAGPFSWADASDLTTVLGSGTSFFAIPAGTTVYGVYNSSDTAYVTVTVQNCPNCNNNIVPNPSFENTIYCPTAMNELSSTPPWSNPPPNPYQGAADAFNQCGLTLGLDAAHSGIGHAGVVVYEPTATFREYLQVQLDSVMQPGDCYQVSMYVKLSESLGSTFSIDSLGMHISNAPPVQSGGGTGLMNVTPQITNDATADLTSYSWQLISGTYTASGGEQFISIGNFADDINSNPVQIGSISFEGYYVVDDICIYKIEPDTLDLSAVNDTVSCEASVLLSAPSGYSNYSWLDSTGSLISSSASLLVSATGMSQHVLFFVDTTTCPITYYRDSVLVHLIIPPDAGLSGNINICSSSAGVTMIDSLGGFPDTLGYWLPSTAVNGTFDPASDTPGTYNYIVSNGVCDNDTAELYISIEAELSSGTAGSISICSTEGNFDLMNSLGGTPDAGGTWSPPLLSGTGIFDPGSDLGGTYTYAHAATSACPSSSTESVVVIGIPADPGGDGTASICHNATPFILADSLTGTPNSNGSWTPSITGITFDPASNGSGTYIYEITGTDGCPDSSSSVYVTIHPEPTVTISNDTTVQPNSSFSLMVSGGNSYLWSPADGLSCSHCPNPMVIASSDVEYCVIVTDANGCTKSDCMNIYLDLSGSVWAPNIFSPNGDGLNDVFYVRGPINPDEYRFLVFNRWGQVVFESEDPNIGWDGTQNRVKLNTGVFNYLALGATLPGTEFKIYGNITLFVK